MKSNRAVRTLIGGAVTAVAVIGLSSGAASADPKSGETVDLTCPGAPTVEIATNGNGAWTPGLEIGSNTVYQPVGFGPQQFEIRDSDGNVIDGGVDPEVDIKNGNRKGQSIIECTFYSAFEGEDPELGYIEGEFSGTVYVVER